MKRIAIACLVAAGAAGMVNAQAETFFDNARVRNVEPQYENVSVPRQQCSSQWVNEEQRVDSGQGRNYAGVAIGGIAGGVLGNQVGHGSGRAAATAVGAVVGAMLGDRLGNQARAPQYQVVPREVTTCQTVNDVQSRVAGYRVAYDYRGQVHHTVMPRDPGQYVQVRVSVDPVVQ
ncbi:MAG: glycine zipper 2TM domain-containing protein [Comamonadaceae bacterium]|nr:MAG: glycine zipper 2TM domain-containing protein [Comamonadaceae bacterium]